MSYPARLRLRPAVLAFALLAGRRLDAAGFGPESIAWRRIGREQGFSGGAVSCIVQDRSGLVWIGTTSGLYRYDGHGFEEFKPGPGVDSLASSSISAIVEDRRGDLWAGSDGGGLARRDALEGRFEPLRLPGESEEVGRIAALAVDGVGRVLVGTREGAVLQVDPAGGASAPLAARGELGGAVVAMLVDSRERLWVGTDGGGLHLFDAEAGRAAVFSRDVSSTASLASDRVSAIIEDSLGFVWIGFSDGGIDLFEDGRFAHARREGTDGRPLPPVAALGEDIRGQIWVAFRGGGLGILDPSSMEVSVSSFPAEAEVRALMRDRRGLLWAGLDRGGILTGDFRSAAFSRFSVDRDGARLGSAPSWLSQSCLRAPSSLPPGPWASSPSSRSPMHSRG